MIYSEADLKTAFVAGYIACHEDYDNAFDTDAAAVEAWEKYKPAPVEPYKNPHCTINHPGSACNIACGY
jgi:hypothetical protein